MTSGRKEFSLLELNACVRNTLQESLPERYWVRAEISEARIHPSGHCYLELIEKEEQSGKTVAKARATIWATTFRLLQPWFEQSTGQLFTSGIKILIQVSISFHELYGYNLTVHDIDPAYTLGDAARRRAAILQQLREEGVADMNKELTWPILPQRIAVISSPSAAGYGDFMKYKTILTGTKYTLFSSRRPCKATKQNNLSFMLSTESTGTKSCSMVSSSFGEAERRPT